MASSSSWLHTGQIRLVLRSCKKNAFADSAAIAPSFFFCCKNRHLMPGNGPAGGHHHTPSVGLKRKNEDIGTYLENFLGDAAGFPAELQRSLTLIRELDEKVVAQHDALVGIADLVRGGRIKGTDPIKSAVERMKANQKDTLSISDNKISLLQQLIESVDRRIRDLETDMRRFEEDLRAEGGVVPTSVVGRSSLESGGGRADKKMSTPGPPTKQRATSATKVRTIDDNVIGNDEPVYCICRQVSFGEMIACDNADCPIEWFHFQCVGLEESPNRTWFCPDCRAKRRQGLLKI